MIGNNSGPHIFAVFVIKIIIKDRSVFKYANRWGVPKISPFGLFLVAVGAFSMAGGIYNWDWFMNNRRARFIVKIFTRKGARIFYGSLGLILVVAGILVRLGSGHAK